MNNVPVSRLSDDIEIVRNNSGSISPEAGYYEALERVLDRASEFAEIENTMRNDNARVCLKEYEDNPSDARLDELVDIVRRAIVEIDPERLGQVAGVRTNLLQVSIDDIAALRQHVRDFPGDYTQDLYRSAVDQIVTVVRELGR